jgi:hypothetical protein
MRLFDISDISSLAPLSSLAPRSSAARVPARDRRKPRATVRGQPHLWPAPDVDALRTAAHRPMHSGRRAAGGLRYARAMGEGSSRAPDDPSDRKTAPPPEPPARPAQVSRAIREALQALARESVADDVLYAAMLEAEISVLPELGGEVRAFVERHLLPEVRATLGDDAEEHVRDRLEPIVRALERTERVAPPRAMTTLRPSRRTSMPPGKMASQTVCIVALEPTVVSALRIALAHVAPVESYRSLVELIGAWRARATDPRPVIIVDCRSGALAAPRAPEGTLEGARVLLWQAREPHRQLLARALPRSECVALCSDEVDLVDVALLARMAFDTTTADLEP